MLGPFNSGSPSVSPIKGYGPPTTSTAGAIGQHYEDLTNQKEYVCFGVSSGAYIWVMPGANDAGDIRYNGRTVKAALEDLEAIGMKCFGVQWDYNNPSTALTRLTRATDPSGYVTVDITEEPVPAVGTGAGSSPFDAYLPWSGMEEYNIVNGVVSYARGNSNFSRTNYDTVVYIPKFYYHIEKDATAKLMRFYICDQPRTGFSLHPGSGRYVGRYHCGEGYVSKSGLAPQTNITRATARAGITGRGSGFYQYDFASWCAVWLLCLVEYADWDSQSKIGKGNTFSGSKQNTGGTDSMVYHTGRAAGTDGNVAAQYRHIEEAWGNVYDWCDGINYNSYVGYVCLDPSKYADNVFTGDYVSMGVTQNSVDDYITELDVSESFPFAFVPTKGGGSDATYIPDYSGVGYGRLVVYVGGYYDYGTDGGLFMIDAWSSASYARDGVGARLLFIP